MSNYGFRILDMPQRPDKKLVESFAGIPTPLISDNMNRMQAVSTDLRPYHPSQKILGVAFTVKTRPGDNLMFHKALDLAQPGDVIVVDAGGDLTNSLTGEIMMRIAMKNGLAGFVIDGAIRDSAAFRESDFPCFAKGVTHRGPYKDGPGEINVPVSIGGMLVNPGDIIVGDEDGLLAVPLEFAPTILEQARKKQQAEAEIMRSIEEGTVDRSWIDKILLEKGCAWNDRKN